MSLRVWLRELSELLYPTPPLCPLCRTRVLPDGLPICRDCVERINPDFQKLNLSRYEGYVLCYYHDYLQQLLYQVKYQNQYQIAVALGEVLGLAAKEEAGLAVIDYFLPVPLHIDRLHKRGFNQAEALAEGINRVWRRPTYEAFRHKPTEPQSLLSPPQRFKNLQNAFSLSDPTLVKGKHFLIIDDIFTTGATFFSLADLIARCRGIPIGLFLAKSG